MQKPDSLIFDMDGTLWDAVDTYAHSWNVVFSDLGIDKTITRDVLAGMVGMEGKKVIEILMPEFEHEKTGGDIRPGKRPPP
jgi:phosphoglycolate phosphatase